MMSRLQSAGTGLSPSKSERFHLNVILRQDGGEFQITGVAAVGERRFAVALQKIRFERLGVDRAASNMEVNIIFALKRNRLAPEFAFLFIGNLFERVLGQRVAGNDFGAVPSQSKMMRFLSVGELSLYCALIFSASPASRT